jgi:hypothetical protein
MALLNPFPLRISACNTIAWNDEDCGECVIDENGNPSFDCTNVGGPEAPANDTTSAADDYAGRTAAGSLLLCGAVVALAVM